MQISNCSACMKILCWSAAVKPSNSLERETNNKHNIILNCKLVTYGMYYSQVQEMQLFKLVISKTKIKSTTLKLPEHITFPCKIYQYDIWTKKFQVIQGIIGHKTASKFHQNLQSEPSIENSLPKKNIRQKQQKTTTH